MLFDIIFDVSILRSSFFLNLFFPYSIQSVRHPGHIPNFGHEFCAPSFLELAIFTEITFLMLHEMMFRASSLIIYDKMHSTLLLEYLDVHLIFTIFIYDYSSNLNVYQIYYCLSVPYVVLTFGIYCVYRYVV